MEKLTVKNPFNQDVVGELPYCTEQVIEKKMFQAYEIAENPRKWLPKSERISILKSLKEQIVARRDECIEQAVLEGGKPFKDSTVEIDRAVAGVEVAIEAVSSLSGREIPMNVNASSIGRRANTHFRPRGLVIGVSAFNHPFNLIIHQAIPALAAGCPFLIKPASTTPMSCQTIISMLHEAGLPKEYGNIAIVKNDLATKMVQDPRQRFLSFIGSARVGWSLRSQLPPGAECALEHGGVAPVIIDETADLDRAVPLLAKGGYYHAGQVCVSVQRIYVHASRIDEFTEKFAAAVRELKVGDSMDPETDVGPLILPREVDRVAQWVDEAVQGGATQVLGAGKVSDTVYSPTILTGVPKDSKMANEEVFGPVTWIEKFEKLDEAIEQANSLPVAFQASIFTENLDTAMRASEELEGLTIMVNDHTAFRVDWMPFGGYKNSGSGVGGIPDSIHHMSIEKMTVIKSGHLTI